MKNIPKVLTHSDVPKSCVQCFARNALLDHPAPKKCAKKKVTACLFDHLTVIPFNILFEALEP